MTHREFQFALSKLLTNVKNTRNWSEDNFTTLAKNVGMARTEASRFYNALVDMDLLRWDKQREAYVGNFCNVVWEDEDAKLGLMRELMEMFPIRLRKGRVKGSHNKTAQQAEPQAQKMAEVAIIAQAEINPLSSFSASDLVAELRNRGYEVKASKVITTIEEL